MTIAERLKAERERMGLTQREVAIKADITDRSQMNYESGKSMPNGDYFAVIAQIGFDIQYVITGTRGKIKESYIDKISQGRLSDTLESLLRKCDEQKKEIMQAISLVKSDKDE